MTDATSRGRQFAYPIREEILPKETGIMSNPLEIGVSNVSRSVNGTRYTITRNSDSRIVVGYVEVTGVFFNVRDACNEPVSVGTAQYDLLCAAVKAYRSWAEKHS